MFTDRDLYIISSGGQTQFTNQGGIAVLVKHSLLYVTIRDANQGLQWKRTDISVPKDTWFHLGLIFGLTNGLKIFINGIEEATTQPISYNPSGSDGYAMQLGKPNTGSSNFGAFSIDEWYFWESMLMTHHMLQIYEKYSKGLFVTGLINCPKKEIVTVQMAIFYPSIIIVINNDHVSHNLKSLSPRINIL